MRHHEFQLRSSVRLIEEQAGILTREVELVKDSLAVNKFLII